MARRITSAENRKNINPAAAAMLTIIFVVLVLMAVLFFRGIHLKKRIAEIESKTEQLEQQILSEELRTRDIEELNIYMQSDEYIEQTAKDKLGLVNDNEIIFKEAG